MLDDTISEEDVSKHRDKFNLVKMPTENDRFQFALTLIRCKHKNEIAEGLALFQNLFAKTADEDIKRDSLYYMAVAQTKLSNYDMALKYIQSILNVQSNEQVLDLQAEVNKRMKRDGLIGIGIASGAALVGLVGMIGLGAAMLVGKKK